MSHEFGRTKAEALEKARSHTKRTGEPTLVYFFQWFEDLGKRYQWCTEHWYDMTQPCRDCNIVWMSNE